MKPLTRAPAAQGPLENLQTHLAVRRSHSSLKLLLLLLLQLCRMMCLFMHQCCISISNPSLCLPICTGPERQQRLCVGDQGEDDRS